MRTDKKEDIFCNFNIPVGSLCEIDYEISNGERRIAIGFCVAKELSHITISSSKNYDGVSNSHTCAGNNLIISTYDIINIKIVVTNPKIFFEHTQCK